MLNLMFVIVAVMLYVPAVRENNKQVELIESKIRA